MKKMTIVLHGNLFYAEYSFKDIPRMIQDSYIPVLEVLKDHPEIKVVLNFPGSTLRILEEENTRVLELIEEGLDEKRFELTACTYAHALVPMLSVDDVLLQIKWDLDIKKKLFNYEPRGFFPPEMAHDPRLPWILSKLNLDWMIFDDELIEATEKQMNDQHPFKVPPKYIHQYTADVNRARSLLGKFKSMLSMKKKIDKEITRIEFTPVKILGTGATVTGFRNSIAWTTYTMTSMIGVPFFTNTKAWQKRINKLKSWNGLFIPYVTDIEFIGLRDVFEGKTIFPEKMVSALKSLKEVDWTLPTEYLEKASKNDFQKVYLKTGSWTHDKSLRLWDEDQDNKKLNETCKEAKKLLEKIKTIDPELYKTLLEPYLLSWNSDGRGWDPIPEKRLFCYEQAMKVISESLARVSNP